MCKLRGRLTYANVMATIAVFIALGGASYAAVRLPKNSVGTKQLKRSSVTKQKVRNNAISTPKIVNDAVTGAKVKEETLGTVPTAETANMANLATAADTADSANTLGGLGPDAFVAARRLRIGIGHSTAVPAETILSMPEIGAAVETDGDQESEKSVLVRNTGADTLAVPKPAGVNTISAGQTFELAGASDPWIAGDSEALILLQRFSSGAAAFVHCYFPGGGSGGIITICEGSLAYP